MYVKEISLLNLARNREPLHSYGLRNESQGSNHISSEETNPTIYHI